MVSVWGVTDRGLVRRQNQDSCAYEVMGRGDAWGVVCDGMGGAKSGDIASNMAVDTFQRHIAQWKRTGRQEGEEQMLLRAVEEANQEVYRRSQWDLDCAGMGTTLVGLLLRKDILWTVNVGDSRAYHITKDAIWRITRDHSVVEDLVEKGDLTPEEARKHPQKNLITRALGTARSVKADLFLRPVQKGDTILLCSDGLINEVTDQELYQEILVGGTPQEICRRLLDRTLERGAPDNVTIVLFQL